MDKQLTHHDTAVFADSSAANSRHIITRRSNSLTERETINDRSRAVQWVTAKWYLSVYHRCVSRDLTSASQAGKLTGTKTSRLSDIPPPPHISTPWLRVKYTDPIPIPNPFTLIVNLSLLSGWICLHGVLD